ncbi:MAG TPA: carboxypeptidase-like regulatory domain-containing protein [Polyangiaceae bacterium]
MTLLQLLPCFLAVAVFGTACGDPVRDDAVAALGGEAPGVRHGPLHRPGQPCTLCHDGGRAGAFSIAGTVFRSADTTAPLVGAQVRLTDATGATRSFSTNAAGSFYAASGDYSPAYPLWVTIAFGGDCLDMKTQDFRDASCASCHADPPSNQSMGHVYFEGPRADGGLAFRPGCR